MSFETPIGRAVLRNLRDGVQVGRPLGLVKFRKNEYLQCVPGGERFLFYRSVAIFVRMLSNQN